MHIGSISEIILNIFLIYCKFEWNCVFKYKTISLIQSIIELNIFKNDNYDFEKNLIYFQLVWNVIVIELVKMDRLVLINLYNILLNNSNKHLSDKNSLISLFNQRKS